MVMQVDDVEDRIEQIDTEEFDAIVKKIRSGDNKLTRQLVSEFANRMQKQENTSKINIARMGFIAANIINPDKEPLEVIRILSAALLMLICSVDKL